MWTAAFLFFKSFLGNRLVQYGLVALIGWGAFTFVGNVFKGWAEYENLVEDMGQQEKLYTSKIAEKDAVIVKLQEDLAKTNSRREHWRQSFYRKQNQLEDFKSDNPEFKKWADGVYPAAID